MPASLTLGDIRVTHIPAGTYWWDGGAFFGVVPKTLWSKHRPPDELNRIEAAFNCYVIETANRRILVETGGGVRHDSRWKERTLMQSPVVLGEALSKAGFEPESIDIVINTHLHWDHASGNTMDHQGRVLPALPHAKYLVQRTELAHGRTNNPRDGVSYIPVNYEPLLDSGHMELLDGTTHPAPGVTLEIAPGHNNSMMIVKVQSGADTWCHLADLAPFAAHITPNWTAAFDLFPLTAIETKQQVLGQAAREGWHLSFGHDPSVAFAKIEVLEGKWKVIWQAPHQPL